MTTRQDDATRRDDARHDDARHDDARHDDARHDDARHDDARHDDARHDDSTRPDGGGHPDGSAGPSASAGAPGGRWRRLSRPLIALGVVAAFGAGMCAGGAGSGSRTPADHAHADADAEVWTCVMHLQIRSPEPGQCPICGMDLVKASSLSAPAAGEDAADDRRVSLSERARVLARVRTAEVEPLVAAARSTRLLGRVDYDETRVKTVTAWTGGRLDRLVVAATGQRIRPGQAIAYLYSPETYAAHSDLIQARRHALRLADSGEAARKAADAALAAARTRLRLLGVPDREIDAMEAADAPARQVAIRTPIGGTVIERLASEGSYVAAGGPLYRVADLSRVWVQLDAYEADAPLLAVGAPVTLAVSSLPGRTFTGQVAFVDPVVDPRRRVIRVRVEVANPGGALRPGMFAEAVLHTRVGGDAAPGRGPGGDPGPGLMIPATAPLFTGRRSVVYVEVPGAERPTYEAREVELGPRAGDVYPVLAGLALGERVVVQGAFVLDADLQIAGGASMMTAPDDADRSRAPPELPAAMSARLADVVAAYLAAQSALAGDDAAEAAAAGGALREAVAATSSHVPQRLRKAWDPLAVELVGYAAHLAGASGAPADADALVTARRALAGASARIGALLERFGNPTGDALTLAYCPMAAGGRGAPWVQRGDELRNPYMGQAEPACGEVRDQVAPGALLAPDDRGRRAAPATHDHGGGADDERDPAGAGDDPHAGHRGN